MQDYHKTSECSKKLVIFIKSSLSFKTLCYPYGSNFLSSFNAIFINANSENKITFTKVP